MNEKEIKFTIITTILSALIGGFFTMAGVLVGVETQKPYVATLEPNLIPEIEYNAENMEIISASEIATRNNHNHEIKVCLKNLGQMSSGHILSFLGSTNQREFDTGNADFQDIKGLDRDCKTLVIRQKGCSNVEGCNINTLINGTRIPLEISFICERCAPSQKSFSYMGSMCIVKEKYDECKKYRL